MLIKCLKSPRNMSTVCCGCRQNQYHFWIFEFHKVVYQHITCEVKSLLYIRRKFSYESIAEITLKIGPHLPKLLSNVKGIFIGAPCTVSIKNHENLFTTFSVIMLID